MFLWFGNYPPIYHLTVRSACQSGVDQVLLYGDEPPCLYPNLRWIPLTLQDITRRVRRVFPEAPHYVHSYKLCDLRPLYFYMFEEDLSAFDYWMWQDLDAMCGSFDIVRPYLRTPILALSHNRYRLGGHWQLYSPSLFRGHLRFWMRHYYSARPWFLSENTFHGLDEGWFHDLFHRLGIGHLHAPALEEFGSVHYVDGHLLKQEAGEFWTYHFNCRYRKPEYMAVPTAVYESDSLDIRDQGAVPVRVLGETAK
jgi:hypothetical protein